MTATEVITEKTSSISLVTKHQVADLESHIHINSHHVKLENTDPNQRNHKVVININDTKSGFNIKDFDRR